MNPVALAFTRTVARAAGLARLRDFAGAAVDEHGLCSQTLFSPVGLRLACRLRPSRSSAQKALTSRP